MEQLLSQSQIERNLRRTASLGLISKLNKEQLEELAFKYFGTIDEDGYYNGYQCPYSGKIYTDYSNIVLEHIIPVNGYGGTTIFNCIPTSEEVNKKNEKGIKHLIDWWINSKYWDKDAPKRLEKIVNYILEGYDIYLNEEIYDEEEIEKEELIDEENEYQSDDDINEQEEQKKIIEQTEQIEFYSYYVFLTKCIEILDNNNIDTSEIKEKLEQLKEENVFENIAKYQMFQTILEKAIISQIEDDNRSYLTYMLNLDIKKLMDSISYADEEKIEKEIRNRLINIKEILEQNNRPIIDYYKCLKEIEDINILYKNIDEIDEKEVKIFAENISVSFETKLSIFIEMLNEGNSEIIRQRNKETLNGYPSIPLSYFWGQYAPKIEDIIFKQEKENPKYDIARKTVLDYHKVSTIEEYFKVKNLSPDKKIEIYIEMLNKGNSEIIRQRNKETLNGYPSIPLSYFWDQYAPKIEDIIFKQEKENPKYDIARKTVLDYHKVSTIEEYFKVKNLSPDKKIEIYIEMLNKGNSEIIRRRNKETLNGYPSIPLGYFWDKYAPKIEDIIFNKEKENPKYDIARQTILNYHKVSTIEEYFTKKRAKQENLKKVTSILNDKKIEIYIEMLNKGNSEIIRQRNKETLNGYPSIPLGYFWNKYAPKIEDIIFNQEKDNPKYEIARKTVLDYHKVSTIEEYFEKKENKKRTLKKSKTINKVLKETIEEVNLLNEEEKEIKPEMERRIA